MNQIFAYKKVPPLPSLLKKDFFSCLSSEEKNKIESFKRLADKETALLSRALLRKMIAAELGMDPQKVDFFYNKYGRPFLRGRKNFDFNVSHSGAWLVWILAKNQRVGIDIEKIRPVEEVLTDSCFTEEEKRHIYRGGNFDQEKFFELWTLKEAFIKADGRGLSYSLQDFYFQTNPQIKLKTKKSDQAWYFKQYNLDSDYKLAVCSNCDVFPEAIDVISEANLLNRL